MATIPPPDADDVTFAFRPCRGKGGERRLVFTISYPAQMHSAPLIQQAVGTLLEPLRAANVAQQDGETNGRR